MGVFFPCGMIFAVIVMVFPVIVMLLFAMIVASPRTNFFQDTLSQEVIVLFLQRQSHFYSHL